MKWLRDLARVLAKANRGIAWTTPAGFRVVHEIREPKTVRIATSDRTLVVYQEDETRKIDSRKQADGIVAHLVIANFLKEQMKAHPDLDLPALPAAGNLDIRQVLSSPYLFA
jgi:DNA-directed RNA polymerase